MIECRFPLSGRAFRDRVTAPAESVVWRPIMDFEERSRAGLPLHGAGRPGMLSM
jgi:hypothetical protein